MAGMHYRNGGGNSDGQPVWIPASAGMTVIGGRASATLER